MPSTLAFITLVSVVLMCSATVSAQAKSIPAAVGCPSLKVEGPKTADKNKSVSYKAKVKDFPGSPSYSWSVLGGTIISGQGTKKIKVNPTAHRVKATVTVTNAPAACTLIETATTRINGLPNSPPVIIGISSSQPTISLPCNDGTLADNCRSTSNTAIQLTVDASDPDFDELTYTWTTSGGKLSGENPASWDLTGAQPGSYTAMVTINDEEDGTITSTFSITVAQCTQCSKGPLTTVIFGVITDSNGNPLPGVTVTLEGGTTRSQVTQADGSYLFRTLPLGEYRITAVRGSRRAVDTTKLVGSTDEAECNIKLPGGP